MLCCKVDHSLSIGSPNGSINRNRTFNQMDMNGDGVIDRREFVQSHSAQTGGQQHLQEQLRQTQHANMQLMQQMRNQNSQNDRARLRNGGMLQGGYGLDDLEEMERQIREQESLLAGYRRENENLADQMNFGNKLAIADAALPVPVSVPIGGGTFIGASSPQGINMGMMQSRNTAAQQAAYITDAPAMLAQISDRIARLPYETNSKQLFQNWSAGSRFSMTFQQFAAGLESLGLYCKPEVVTALLTSFDNSGESALKFGDFVKLVHQVRSQSLM